MKMRTWIVAADDRRARVFEAIEPVNGQIHEVETLTYEELVDGGDEAGAAVSEQAPKTDVKGREQLAEALTEYLKAAEREGMYDHLVLLAKPPLLKILQKRLMPDVEPLLWQAIEDDMSLLDVSELPRRLPDKLATVLGRPQGR